MLRRRGARTAGRFLNRLYRSENYELIQKASDELRNLPQRLARAANLEEELNRLKEAGQELKQAQADMHGTLPEVQARSRELPNSADNSPTLPLPPPQSPPSPPRTPRANEEAFPSAHLGAH